VACFSLKYPEVNVAAGKTVVAVPTYVTNQARLKLDEYPCKKGQSVVYCDADSVIFIKDYDPKETKRGIIWVKSQMSWRSTAIVPVLKYLYRVAKKTIRFGILPFSRKSESKCNVKCITMKYDYSNVENNFSGYYSTKRAAGSCTESEKDKAETWWCSGFGAGNKGLQRCF